MGCLSLILMTSCAGDRVTADLCPSFSQWLPDHEPKRIFLDCEPAGSGPVACQPTTEIEATHVVELDYTVRWSLREKRLKVTDNRKIASFCKR